MAVLYPRTRRAITIPRDLDGTPQNIAFSVAHERQAARVHWYLDGAYVGVTAGPHELPLRPPPGEHVLTLVDERGVELRWPFRVSGGAAVASIH